MMIIILTSFLQPESNLTQPKEIGLEEHKTFSGTQKQLTHQILASYPTKIYRGSIMFGLHANVVLALEI